MIQHHTRPFDDAEKCAWLRLARTENVGPMTFYRLLQRFRTAQAALDALPDMARKGGRQKPLIPPPLADVMREYESLRAMGGDILCAGDSEYPAVLAAVEDAPPVISIIGNKKLLHRQAIGMVGARNASLNGRNFARKLAADLGAHGMVVVSGLARGIDTAAHEGSLQSGTIAVVAGGIDVVYPPENGKLYDSIRDHGLIVAESRLSQEPFAQSFPRRNRIISGLSQGVVVVEASLRSGSLITARVAGEQGRDVFAVPGHPADPRAEGTNALIRDGAIMVRGAQDVLDDLNRFNGGMLFDAAGGLFHVWNDNQRESGDDGNTMPAQAVSDPVPVDPDFDVGAAILDQLSTAATDIDALVRAIAVPVPMVQSALLTLELAGRIQRLPGNRVVRLAA